MFENYSHILIDGTFFSVPKCVYQIIITRFALEYHHKYFTTSFTLSSNKKEDTYKEIFKIINNNIKEYQLKNKLKINFRPKNIHCDMEIVLINAIQFIWPYSNVKICYFHWNQAMEKNRKKYKDIFENNVSNNEAFKCLLTLPLIQEDVVESVFNELKSNNLCLELKELFDYYEKMFIIKFKPPMWNYYNTENNRTNNACENYNKSLNSYFTTKPTIIKLINILSIEENVISNEYSEIVNEGFITKRKRIGPSDYMSCLPYFIEKNDELKGNSNSDKKKRIEIWLEAARRLPIK